MLNNPTNIFVVKNFACNLDMVLDAKVYTTAMPSSKIMTLFTIAANEHGVWREVHVEGDHLADYLKALKEAHPQVVTLVGPDQR